MKTLSQSVSADGVRRLASGWLILALTAIGISTLFALLLVVSRTPFLNHGFLAPDFFTTALVLHVDFAVLVWFLAFAGVVWSLLCGARGVYLAWLALLTVVFGVGLMLVAAFLGEGQPALSNYIPVLKGPVFLSGLGLFGLGVSMMVLRSLMMLMQRRERMEAGLHLGAWCAALVVLFSLLILAWNYWRLPEAAGGSYFEMLFWGSGHVLQFNHVLMMLVVWMVLARQAGIRVGGRMLFPVVLLLTLAPVLLTPIFQWLFEPDSQQYRQIYTQLMRYGSWPPAVVIAMLLLRGYFTERKRADEAAVAANVLLFSVLLFIAGILSGALIKVDNVLVTAHYHGTVGAVTLAFMGLTYYLLPRLGARELPVRGMRLQVRLYGGGMLTLISGLLWSGLHDVPRKVPGEAQLLENAQELAGMMLMGAGGLVALLATWMYLLLALRSLWPVGQTLFQMRMDQPG